MNRDTLEQDPCNTCGYEEGSIYCKEHCPHEANIEQEPVFFPPCQDCNTKMNEIRRAYDKLQEPSGDAIDRKIISAFLSGLISDETERKKALQYINELPPVNPTKTGHWEWVQYDYNPKLGNWHCSECRCIVVECVDKEEKGGIPLYKYCPQCGAKMQEAEIEG